MLKRLKEVYMSHYLNDFEIYLYHQGIPITTINFSVVISCKIGFNSPLEPRNASPIEFADKQNTSLHQVVQEDWHHQNSI